MVEWIEVSGKGGKRVESERVAGLTGRAVWVVCIIKRDTVHGTSEPYSA